MKRTAASSKTKKEALKLICTIGPTSESKTVIRGLIKAGVSALRINLSHTPLEKTIEIVKNIRSISKKIPIIIDTQGKEIRMSAVAGKPVILKKGDVVKIIAKPEGVDPALKNMPDQNALLISNATLFLGIKTKDQITLDDNSIAFRVIKCAPDHFTTVVLTGGTVHHPKNIRLDRKYSPKKMLTERDRAVITAMKKYGLAEVSLSYAATAKDVQEARRFAGPGVTITSKIETREAVVNIDELLTASDTIMIDRNDLGTEIGYEKIPLVQKFITSRAIKAGKPVLIATHLLESMVKNPKPTRGEVNDIVNLVLDGVSGLILSSESAIGHDPVKTFKTLAKLAAQGEFILEKRESNAVGSVIDRLTELNYL